MAKKQKVQHVALKGEVLGWKKGICGAPEGCVFRLILLNIFINDIGSTGYRGISNKEEEQNSRQEELDELPWSYRNGMRFKQDQGRINSYIQDPQ